MRFDAPQPDEFPLIYDSWAKSFRKSPWAGCVPNHLWPSTSRATTSEILNRGARVIVAVEDIEAGRRVLGYSVSEPATQCLHWLFVKRDFRGIGLRIGTQLLAETTRDWPRDKAWLYSHRTNASSRFLGAAWRHEPKLARVKAP